MKKVLLLTVLAVLACSIAGYRLQKRYEVSQRQCATAQASRDSVVTRFDQAVASIAEIQDSLDTLLPSEKRVLDITYEIEHGSRMTKPMNEQMLQSISDLKKGIQAGRQMVDRLERKVRDGDVKVAGLEQMVGSLRRRLVDREALISALSARVDSLQGHIVVLQADLATGVKVIEEQSVEIAAKQREISTVSCLIGTKKRLKGLGVLQDAGGFLGLRKGIKLSREFPAECFNAVDLDQDRVIPVRGKDPEVLTDQSRSSYELVSVTKDQFELRVTDPTEFRKVRYLVIRVG